MNALVYITRLIGGLIFMMIVAIAAVTTVALGILWDTAVTIWDVLIVGKTRKF